MNDASPKPAPGGTHPLHLAWAVPIGLVASWFAALWMTLNWCGVSGCSGAGFGRISEPSLGAVLMAAAVTAVIWFVLIAEAPWHPSRRMRLIVAGVVAIVVSTLLMVVATDGFVR